MSKRTRHRRDTNQPDLLDWQPASPVVAYAPERVRAASLGKSLSKAVSETLKSCGRSRSDVAKAMSDYLDEAIGENILNAYASEARDEHIINVVRFIGQSVARFAGCTGYLDRTSAGRWRYIYFGRSADVLIAEYVHEVTRRAADGAIARFKASDDYRRRRTAKTRLRALKAFAEGFAAAMAAKLRAGLWRRVQAQHGNGVALVVQQNEDALKAELARRGMAFRETKAIATAGARYKHSTASGYVAGRSVGIEAAVSGAATPVAGLLT